MEKTINIDELIKNIEHDVWLNRTDEELDELGNEEYAYIGAFNNGVLSVIMYIKDHYKKED